MCGTGDHFCEQKRTWRRRSHTPGGKTVYGRNARAFRIHSYIKGNRAAFQDTDDGDHRYRRHGVFLVGLSYIHSASHAVHCRTSGCAFDDDGKKLRARRPRRGRKDIRRLAVASFADRSRGDRRDVFRRKSICRMDKHSRCRVCHKGDISNAVFYLRIKRGARIFSGT